MNFEAYVSTTSFKGEFLGSEITGSFETGMFTGDYFFNGDWVQSILLNHFNNMERILKDGNKTNQRVAILLDFYEWVIGFGSAATMAHYGKNSFKSKIALFKEANFDEKFILKLENYIPIECPQFRQWKRLFKFSRRPLVLLT